MGMAPVAHVLWNKFMTFNPKNPDWVNRDRFVLSYVSLHPIAPQQSHAAHRSGQCAGRWHLRQLSPRDNSYQQDLLLSYQEHLA
jgi:hypothetical protein